MQLALILFFQILMLQSFAQSSTAVACSTSYEGQTFEINIDSAGKGTFKTRAKDQKSNCEVLVVSAKDNLKHHVPMIELQFGLKNCEVTPKAFPSNKFRSKFVLNVDFSDNKHPVGHLNNFYFSSPAKCKVSKVSKLSLTLYAEKSNRLVR